MSDQMLILFAVSAAAFAVGMALVVLLAPTRTTINLDTEAFRFEAVTRPLWGRWPAIDLLRRTAPKGAPRSVRAHIETWLRTARSAMSLTLVRDFVAMIVRLARAHDIRDMRLHIGLAGGPIITPLAVAGVQTVIDKLPTPLRGKVNIEAGSDLSVRFFAELDASPAELYLAWTRFRNGKAAREFTRKVRSA